MRFNVSLENFRCFAAVGPVPIAPVTLLVGENSTGKTSFLAALRIMVEAFDGPTSAAFNREPYFLGSFEQIAHYRGGRSGRAKQFSLSVQPDVGQGDLFHGENRISRQGSHRLVFAKGSSQPELVKYSLFSRNISATFDLTSAKPKITVARSGLTEIQIDPDRAPSSFLLRREIAFFGHYLQEMAFRSRRERTDEQASDSNEPLLRTLGASIRSASRTMQREVFASAPVRIQPRRVYIPSELTSLNAGEQVPLEMANLKLSDIIQWNLVKDKLIGFGQRSGLFEDIDVKRFGKTDSDPFQIQIKSHGPSSNIVDVGYGVSQALPLLYPLQSNEGFNFFLLQQPEVHLHPRAQAEFGSLIAELASNNPDRNYVIETHSDYVVDRIRSDVRNGVLSNKDVSILLFKKSGLDTQILNMGLNERGEVTNYPDDYRQFFLHEQARVLGL
jgi:predicted ATPase